jgi:hypothetical protein
MQRHPTHQADDIGARLNEPSSLVDPIRTTGVPKYRIAGSISCEMLNVPCIFRSSCCEAGNYVHGYE